MSAHDVLAALEYFAGDDSSPATLPCARFANSLIYVCNVQARQSSEVWGILFRLPLTALRRKHQTMVLEDDRSTLGGKWRLFVRYFYTPVLLFPVAFWLLFMTVQLIRLKEISDTAMVRGKWVR